MATTRRDRSGEGPDGDIYDTAGRDLLRHGLTLRHRSGEWRLSVPNAHGRMDFQARGGDAPPARVASLIGGVALGRPLARVAAPEAEALEGEASEGSDAGSVIGHYLEAQVRAIVCGDVWFRAGLDAVHSTRVGIRRHRSVLRVFGPLLDGDLPWLDDELRWYAGLLGQVRDPQVQRRRFAAALAELPDGVVEGSVAGRVDGELRREELQSWVAVRGALDGGRYRALLAALGTSPRVAPAGSEDHDVIIARSNHAARQSLRRLATALADGSAADLHRARKAAKRARYASELAAPVLGKALARERIARFTRVQHVLGEYQDSVVAADTLRRMAAGVGETSGDGGFTLGVLYGLEVERARQARAEAVRLAD